MLRAQLNRIVTLAAWIVHPQPGSPYEEARERSRLLRGMQLAVIMTGTFVLAFALALDPEDLDEPEVLGGAAAVALTCALYILARLGRFLWSAAGFIILLFCVFTMVPYLPSGGPWFLAYGVVPVMLTGVFFSLEWMILVSAITIILVYLLNRLTLSRADFWDYQQLWYFQVVACAAVVALVRHLSIVERIRYGELENANQQLRESESLLEERVEQRTAELQTAYEQIQTLNHAKDEFVSNVSHELRTPITSMKMQHHLLEAKATAEQQKHLMISSREIDRLSNLIELLLWLSRLDQGRMEFRLGAIDLNALAQQYVDDRAPLAAERALTLDAALVSEPITVLADNGLIGQALSALLTNAINYTPPGGQITVSTHVITDAAGQRWGALGVRDTGSGIPLDEQPRLFTRFFRGSAAQASGVPGTGLGLSIAKAIVERHQGQVEVESKGIPGEGTLFRILLPCHA